MMSNGEPPSHDDALLGSAAAGSPERAWSFWRLIRSDFSVNSRNWKGLVLLTMYRLAHAGVDAPAILKPLVFIYIAFYKFITEMIVGTEIHWRCQIGPYARVIHGYGLVINSATVIGARCILRHGTTIGVGETDGDTSAPHIGDDVDIGASAIILGPITIGNGVKIGAGCVVTKSVPAGAVVVGNPARVIN